MSDSLGKAQLCEHGIDSDITPCEICRLQKENKRLRDRETQLQKAVKREEDKVSSQRSRRLMAEAQPQYRDLFMQLVTYIEACDRGGSVVVGSDFFELMKSYCEQAKVNIDKGQAK